MQNGSDSAKLQQVKAILQELQRIRPDLARQESQDGTGLGIADSIGQGRSVHAPGASKNARDVTEHPTPQADGQRPRATKTIVLACGVAVAIASVAAGGAYVGLFEYHDRLSAGPAGNHGSASPFASALDRGPNKLRGPASERQAGAAALLDEAQRLMMSGDILLAREILLKSAQDDSADISLALARSYDPNFLHSVANANAAPDVKIAELWYRRWNATGIKEGLVSDTQPLERIIRSMH